MANEEQVARLRKSVEGWNKWRKETSSAIIDLSAADLSDANLIGADLSAADPSRAALGGAHLRGAHLSRANLSGANLIGADLIRADLGGADLSGALLIEADLFVANLSRANLSDANLSDANLSEADLSGANLRKANLRKANLSRANLTAADPSRADLRGAILRGAILSRADLRGADLRGADLSWANLSEADLSGARLSGANLGGTLFNDVDLSQAKGLKTVRHDFPSSIGIDTIYKSKGNIPEVFLRGCGVPENFIVFMHSLTDKAFDFYSCFVSYSTKDKDFAERIYADLQSKGVRCWFAPEDLKIGDKFRTRIDEAIRVYDKLLIVLSENSINSEWVEKEVETAFEKERQQKRTILFPVRLDDAVMKTDQAWAADIRRTRHIGDMTGWKDHTSYQKAFERLLRDLQADPKQSV